MSEPAYPNPELSREHFGNPSGYTGITIRDYFAAAALTGMMSDTDVSYFDPLSVAKNSYDLADAMLAARAPRTGLEQYKRDTALLA